jgi:beta-lactamase regulating signal transducer with metallopeptidase domain
MDIISISLSASLAIVAVVIVRAIFIHKLPKKTFMVLWGIVICRLLLPFSIPSRLSVWNMLEALRALLPGQTAASSLPLPSYIIVENIQPMAFGGMQKAPLPSIEQLAESVDAGSAIDFLTGFTSQPIFFWLWLAGACICALYFLLTHVYYHNIYKTALPVENSFVKQWIATHPLRRKLCINQSDKVDSPLTCGTFRPVILLPSNMDWQNETRLSYVLTHEYVHIRRFHTLLKWVWVLTLSLHWFNPLVWLMYVLANRDMELSCDETVVRSYGESFKSAYALTLVRMMEEKHGRGMSLCSNFCKNAVEERVVSIMKIKRFSVITILATVFLVSGIGVVFATGEALPEALATDSGDSVSATENRDVPRMLFVTSGERAVKVTYDGITWEPYPAITKVEDWKWYSYEEYESYMKLLTEYGHYYYTWGVFGQERDLEIHLQTLEDIAKGIKVSKRKSIFINEGTGPQSYLREGLIDWYCFSYTFTDLHGNEVELGLFETRDELFADLKQYYDREVMVGNITFTEAEALYNNIAHQIRNSDEVPLSEKLRNCSLYSHY